MAKNFNDYKKDIMTTKIRLNRAEQGIMPYSMMNSP